MAEQPLSRWSPVAAYALLSGANQMLWLTFTPITTDAAAQYGVSVGAIGWLAEIFPLLYVVLAIPAGRLIDRSLPLGLAAGAALTAVGAVVRLSADVFVAALVGQVLVAIAQPLVLNAVTKLSGSYLRPGHRPTGIAVSSAGIFAGMVLALLTGTLLGADHLQTLLALQAAVTVVAAGWLCLALRRPGSFAATIQAPAQAVGSLRAVWADRYVRTLVALALIGFGVFVAITTWLQALLEPAGISDTAAGTLLLLMVVCGVVGSAVLPAWVARHRRQSAFLLLSVLVSALALAALAAAPGLATAVPALVLIGALLLTDLPIILELAERRAGPAGGTATALLWMAGNLGGLVLAVVVQVLVDHPAAAFLVLAAAALAAMPCVRTLADPRAAASLRK
ncbi:MAG: MFS transporter [Nocardioidaceae bacterium]